MKFKKLCAALALTVLAGSAVIGAGVAQAAPVGISEGGSTLIYPLAFDWSQAYAALSGNSVSTAAVGSGAGITGVCTGTYDIGASDAPLGYPGVKVCGDGSAATYGHYVEVPWALSATGLLYNINLGHGHHLTSGLDLTSADIVKIYTGQYSKWSQIPNPTQTVTVVKTFHHRKRHWKFRRVHGKKRWVFHKVHGKRRHVFVYKRWTTQRRVTINQRIHLPATPITPVYRSDGSGDSYAFTNFMSLSDSSWRSAYGPSTNFPTGADAHAVGSSGNAGVAHSVIGTNGAIGYVSVYYLITTLGDVRGMGVAAVRNAAGHYEFPNDPNISNAAASASAPPAQNSTKCVVNDPHAASDCFGMVIQYPSSRYKIAYPISTYTYAIVPSSGLGASVAATVRDFLNYAIDLNYGGQPGGLKTGNHIGYVQLSSQLINYCRSVINQIGS